MREENEQPRPGARAGSRGSLARPSATLSAPTLADTLSPNVLRTLTAADLAAFLVKRRWFGAKAGAPRETRVRDVVALPWEGGHFAVARLDVVSADGTATSYQLPLCVRSVEEIGDAPPAGIIARVSTTQGEGLLFDAVEDGAFLRALTDAFAKPQTIERGGTRWVIEPIGAKALVVPATANVSVGSAEQSNTSIVIDELAILKLFRKLESGEHPEVELTRFLTVDMGFAHTPVLLGVIRFEDDAGSTVAAMLQEYLPKSVDAWRFALERSRGYFAEAKGEPQNNFLAEAERLGSITREMHDALARGTSPDLAPEQVTERHLERWARDAHRWIEGSLMLLDRQLTAKGLPKARVAEADALLRRRSHYDASVDEIMRTLGGDAGLAIRIHGDYHLGQVLRTARDDFMIIDFEGEPARSLAERRQKASPLRDVAGMLRSFAYAAATLGMEAKTLDVPTRELRVARWERDTREAFLRGYLGEGQGNGNRFPLPAFLSHIRALLRLFETEKAFYELAYELNNRPDWAWIPMRGIAKLMA